MVKALKIFGILIINIIYTVFIEIYWLYYYGAIGASGVIVLGMDCPVKSFTGRIIEVIRRSNDAEKKWVAAPENMTFTKRGNLGSGSVSGAVY